MRWHRLRAIAVKEVLQIVRDWRSLVIVIVMPIALTLLFGYGVTLDIKHIPTCAFDREGSQQSEDLLKRFAASEYFNLRATVHSYPALVGAIDSGRCKLGLVIPYDFSRRFATGGDVGVQALIDATDDNTANIITAYSEKVIADYSLQVQLDWLYRHGESRYEVPLSVDSRTWFNEALESKAFIVPGVIAIVMAVIGTFLTSLTIAREWERGTMEQLISTPVTQFEVILGKLAPYLVIGLLGTALCTAIGVWWFEIPFRGRLTTLFGTTALFLVAVLGLGFWISAATKSQLVSNQTSLVVTFMPAFVLSGFIFSIDQMPAAIRALTHLVPARYYDSILKGIFLKGVSVGMLSYEIVALAVLDVFVAFFAARAFRKQLE